MSVKLNSHLEPIQERSLQAPARVHEHLEPTYPVNQRISNPQDEAVEDADEDCGTDGDCDDETVTELN